MTAPPPYEKISCCPGPCPLPRCAAGAPRFSPQRGRPEAMTLADVFHSRPAHADFREGLRAESRSRSQTGRLGSSEGPLSPPPTFSSRARDLGPLHPCRTDESPCTRLSIHRGHRLQCAARQRRTALRSSLAVNGFPSAFLVARNGGSSFLINASTDISGSA
jgi:hypothetical protein